MPDSRYLAGYLDAEGCLAVNGSSISVRVTNTHRVSLENLAAAWGGKVVPHGEPTDRHRRTFQWQAYGETAKRVVEAALPYLREKRIQGLLLLQYRAADPQDPVRGWIKTALGELKRLEYPAL